MECVALIISVVSLIIAYLALFYSVLKQGRVEIFPYLDCLEVSSGSKHLDTPKEFTYIVPFMIKNTGAKPVLTDTVIWSADVKGIKNIRANVIYLSPELQSHRFSLAPYDQKVYKISVWVELISCQDKALDLLREEIDMGSIKLLLSYTAFENKKIRAIEEDYDITSRIKKTIFGLH